MQHLKPNNSILSQFMDQAQLFEKNLLDAINQFNLYEKRLLLLAIEETRDMLKHTDLSSISPEHHIAVKATKYVETFGGDIQSAYAELSFACEEIFVKVIKYPFYSKSGRTQALCSRWISEFCISESESIVYLNFPPFILHKLNWLDEMLTNGLNDHVNQ